MRYKRQISLQTRVKKYETKQKILTQLDEERALGKDMLPTRIVKVCAAVTVPPLHERIPMIPHYGEWV